MHEVQFPEQTKKYENRDTRWNHDAKQEDLKGSNFLLQMRKLRCISCGQWGKNTGSQSSNSPETLWPPVSGWKSLRYNWQGGKNIANPSILLWKRMHVYYYIRSKRKEGSNMLLILSIFLLSGVQETNINVNNRTKIVYHPR